jgi:hypothetical protein
VWVGVSADAAASVWSGLWSGVRVDAWAGVRAGSEWKARATNRCRGNEYRARRGCFSHEGDGSRQRCLSADGRVGDVDSEGG